MNAHWIDVFNRANDDAVIRFVADHFHLIFLPAEQAFIDQNLANRRGVDARANDCLVFFPVIGNAATGAAECECRTNDGWQTDFVKRTHGFQISGVAVISGDLAVFSSNGG